MGTDFPRRSLLGAHNAPAVFREVSGISMLRRLRQKHEVSQFQQFGADDEDEDDDPQANRNT